MSKRMVMQCACVSVHSCVCGGGVLSAAGVTHLCSSLQYLGHSYAHRPTQPPHTHWTLQHIHSSSLLKPHLVFHDEDFCLSFIIFFQGGMQLQTGSHQHHLPEGTNSYCTDNYYCIRYPEDTKSSHSDSC